MTEQGDEDDGGAAQGPGPGIGKKITVISKTGAGEKLYILQIKWFDVLVFMWETVKHRMCPATCKIIFWYSPGVLQVRQPSRTHLEGKPWVEQLELQQVTEVRM
jgi:hypothetical protein